MKGHLGDEPGPLRLTLLHVPPMALHVAEQLALANMPFVSQNVSKESLAIIINHHVTNST